MIVYVVTTSTGEKCRIEGVFEDRRQAAYLCAVKNLAETQIEEWDTEGIKFSGTRELLSRWDASIDNDGCIIDMTEGFTFTEKLQFDVSDESGWYATVTLPYGLTEKQAYREIVDRFENWRIARGK